MAKKSNGSTPRVAIYCRKSKDNTGKSKQMGLDRQESDCRRRAEELGYEVAAVYTDEESRSVSKRPGYDALKASLFEKNELDGVIVYDCDRLTGDRSEWNLFRKQLEYKRQFLVDCNGYDSRTDPDDLLGSIRTIVADIETAKLRRRVRAALRYRAENGYCSGNRPYGYRSVSTKDGKYKELVIHEPEAKIVRRIFEMFADGMGAHAIAGELNKEGIPTPRKRGRRHGWMHTGVRVILRNSTYVGELRLCRARVDRTPVERRRVRIALPEEEWVTVKKPELRIVDQRLWNRVQKRIEESAATRAAQLAQGKRSSGRGKYTRLLSGLLKCGVCKRPFEMADRHFYACSTVRGGGACDNRIRVKRVLAEERILAAVRDELLSEKTVREMRKLMQQRLRERKRAAREAAQTGEAAKLKRELAKVETQIDNTTRAIADGGKLASLVETLKRLESEREAIQARLSRVTVSSSLDALPDMLPGFAEQWRAMVEDMTKLGERPDPRRVIAAREWLWENLGDIELRPHRAGHLVAHVGLTNAILPLASGDTTVDTSQIVSVNWHVPFAVTEIALV